MTVVQIIFLALSILATFYELCVVASVSVALSKYDRVNISPLVFIVLGLSVWTQTLFVVSMTGGW